MRSLLALGANPGKDKRLSDSITAQVEAAVTAALGGIAAVPTGVIVPFSGSAAPTGWLLAAGQAVSRATYSALFAVVGVTYGSGDGTTTFNLPDLRGRVVVGLDNLNGSSANRITAAAADSLGGTGGSESHVLSLSELPSHDHGGTSGSGGSHSHTGTATSGGSHTHTTDSGGSHSHSMSFEGEHSHTPASGSYFLTSNTVGQSLSGNVGPSYTYTNNGENTVTLYTSSTGGHDHTINSGGSHTHTIASSGSHTHSLSVDAGGSHTHTIPTQGSGAAHNNVQPYLALGAIIKT